VDAAATRQKVVLSGEDNTALTIWQQANLRIQRCVAGNPWNTERFVIDDLQPALNLADNAAGVFFSVRRDAGRRFRAAGPVALPRSLPSDKLGQS